MLYYFQCSQQVLDGKLCLKCSPWGPLWMYIFMFFIAFGNGQPKPSWQSFHKRNLLLAGEIRCRSCESAVISATTLTLASCSRVCVLFTRKRAFTESNLVTHFTKENSWMHFTLWFPQGAELHNLFRNNLKMWTVFCFLITTKIGSK